MKNYDFTPYDVMSYYYSGPYTLGDVANHFNISNPTAVKYIKMAGGVIKSRQDLYNFGLKEDYFEVIDTEVKAYLLGLITADGCVFYDKKHDSYRFLIQLQEKDAEMISFIKDELCANRKIVIDKRDNSHSITITSNKLCLDLIRWGIVPNKTFRTYLPDLNPELYSHYIRGLFDGDGSLMIHHGHGKIGNVGYRFCIVGNYDLLNSVRLLLVDKLNVPESKVYKEPKGDQLYRITWGARNDVVNICNYMYKNATIYLNRKYEKYRGMLIWNDTYPYR